MVCDAEKNGKVTVTQQQAQFLLHEKRSDCCVVALSTRDPGGSQENYSGQG